MSQYDHPTDPFRRRVVGASLGAAGLAALPLHSAIAQSGEIVVGAAPPITGVFAFAGVGLHQGLGDYCEWRNTKGGVAGRKLRYVGREPPECDLLAECGNYLVVEHSGDVYACDFFVESGWKLGNVMERKLDHMLNSARQRDFGRRKADLPPPCDSCRWLFLCRGGCPKDRIRDPADDQTRGLTPELHRNAGLLRSSPCHDARNDGS
jgi:radical SAM protein with 4Fe4S-binding SPASM domain